MDYPYIRTEDNEKFLERQRRGVDPNAKMSRVKPEITVHNPTIREGNFTPPQLYNNLADTDTQAMSDKFLPSRPMAQSPEQSFYNDPIGQLNSMGVEVAPDNIPQDVQAGQAGQGGQSVRGNQSIARSDFSEPDIDYDFSDPGTVVGTATDSRGNSGTMEAPESLMGNQRGSFNTYSASDVLENPKAQELARLAATGQISTQQYNAGLRSIRQENEQRTQSNNAGQILANKIRKLEQEMARPGRGLNQSLGDMFTEARVRNAKRRTLNKMYELQSQTQQESAADSRSLAERQSREAIAATNRQAQQGIADARRIADENKSLRMENSKHLDRTQRAELAQKREAFDRETRANDSVAEQRKAITDMAKAFKKENKDDFRNMTKTLRDRYHKDPQYEGKPYLADIQVAWQQAQSLEQNGTNLFDTTEGKLAKTALKQLLVKEEASEAGPYDYFKKDPLPMQEIYDLDFADWEVDSGEKVLGNFLWSENRVMKHKPTGRYVYFNNIPSEAWHLIQQLSTSDRNKRALASASDKGKDVRGSQ